MTSSGAEAPVEKRVPEDDPPARAQARRLGVRRRRLRAHLLHAHRDVGEAELGLVLPRLGSEGAVVQLLLRNQVGEHEREQRRQGHEHRAAWDPPPPSQRSGETHDDEDREADEEELASEAEPRPEDPLAVADAGDVVPALPPELREAEGELDDPEDAEPEHREQHPGADTAGRRLADEPHAPDCIPCEHRHGRQLGEEEEPADDAFVVLGALELGGAEDLARIDARRVEARRHDALPEEVRGRCPDAGEREKEERRRKPLGYACGRPRARAPPASGPRKAGGPLYGYVSVSR